MKDESYTPEALRYRLLEMATNYASLRRSVAGEVEVDPVALANKFFEYVKNGRVGEQVVIPLKGVAS